MSVERGTLWRVALPGGDELALVLTAPRQDRGRGDEVRVLPLQEERAATPVCDDEVRVAGPETTLGVALVGALWNVRSIPSRALRAAVGELVDVEGLLGEIRDAILQQADPAIPVAEGRLGTAAPSEARRKWRSVQLERWHVLTQQVFATRAAAHEAATEPDAVGMDAAAASVARLTAAHRDWVVEVWLDLHAACITMGTRDEPQDQHQAKHQIVEMHGRRYDKYDFSEVHVGAHPSTADLLYFAEGAGQDVQMAGNVVGGDDLLRLRGFGRMLRARPVEAHPSRAVPVHEYTCEVYNAARTTIRLVDRSMMVWHDPTRPEEPGPHPRLGHYQWLTPLGKGEGTR